MRSKLTYLLSLIVGLILFSQAAYSEIVPIEKARLVAKNIYYERVNLTKDVSYSSIFFSDEFTVSENGKPVYYVFNISNEPGFVLVSAESNAYPVLGYSFESYFYPENLNATLESEMQNYKNQIVEIRTHNYKSDNESSALWEKYSKTSFTKSTEGITQAGPLVQTKWDQSCFYNTLCPVGSSGNGYCNHVPTGCVATAMAQVMKFWAYPAKGAGSNTYASMGNHSVDFSAQTYNWAAMPNSLTAENNEVAKIMYHAGVAMNMSYSPGGSGAVTANAGQKLATNFKYSTSSQYITKTTNLIDWHIKIRANILSGKPVLYSGREGNYGHAFIIDGFQYPEYYHINLGWGGSGDGYYYLNAINTTNNNGNFNDAQGAVINIFPSTMSGAKLTDENSTSDEAVIYPNPSNGSFSLMINNDYSGQVSIKILDMTSRVIENVIIDKNDSFISHNFNLSHLSNGLYYVSIENNNNRLVKKFIIK